MAVKIITFLSILGINIAAGVVLVFFLMLGLNGFSTRDSNYAFGFFIAGGVLVSFLMATAGLFLVKFLIAKEWNRFLAVLLSVVGFAAVGVILKFIILVIALLVADIVRTSR